MQYSPTQNQAIALAGVFQALHLVDQVATTGYLRTEDFETCVKSLFATTPECTLEVYGTLPKLAIGFEQLEKLLQGSPDRQQKQLIQYGVAVNRLAKQLKRTPKMLSTIAQRLDNAKRQAEQFGISHDNVIANIADLYSQTISTFSYRIQVRGEYNYLQQKRVADQVRTLLLAAIRAAILWQQNGGSVWKLIFSRGSLSKAVEQFSQQSRSID